jgi:predicted nucleic acid-binding protein
VILVDANVALKWFLPEPGAEAALALIAKETLFAPALIRIEVLSGITRCVRTGTATKEESLVRCQKWYEYLEEQVLTIVPDTALFDDAVKLSMAIKHAFRDCLYLAAAQSMKATLVTADRTFRERAKKAYRDVELLAGCGAN